MPVSSTTTPCDGLQNDIPAADNTELYKQFSDNESFRKWLADMIFSLTYKEDVA